MKIPISFGETVEVRDLGKRVSVLVMHEPGGHYCWELVMTRRRARELALELARVADEVEQ